MVWALISTDENIAPIGTIVNIIVYDGMAQYEPPPGMTLSQVPDETHIGDIIEG